MSIENCFYTNILKAHAMTLFYLNNSHIQYVKNRNALN